MTSDELRELIDALYDGSGTVEESGAMLTRCHEIVDGFTDEIDRLTARVAELEAERNVLAAAVEVHNRVRNKIRDWWTFGKGPFAQEHTHSWRTREDFIAMWDRELSKVTEASCK